MPAASKPATDDLFVAMAHPLRRRILRRMLEDGGGDVSPRELAEKLRQPLSRLSYHVKVLDRCGAVELAGTQPVRGSTQHFYRPAVIARWARIALDADAENPPRRRR